MSHASETVLTTIPASETERLLVVLVQSPQIGSRMELRQQSFSKGIGWFTQSTVHLEPQQVATLRNALGSATQCSTNRLPREFSKITPPSWQPRVVHAETAIEADDLLGHDQWTHPRDWGAYFLLFPTRRPWNVPWKAWHLDHDYAGTMTPLNGLKVHSMFGDVAPRSGGMTVVAGSHHLVARHFAEHPRRPGAKGAQLRKELMRSNDYLRELGTDPGATDPDERIARFVDRAEMVDGTPLQVVELTATAGDVILIHPLLLHARPTNAGTHPRFLLNKDLSVTTLAASPR